jgi:hypothetical protein
MVGLGLDTRHCRALDALTRADLQIDLVLCKPTESGEEIILECIRQNRGPTALDACRIDTRRGNSSVTTLCPGGPCSDEDRLVLVQALAENEGLVTLYLNSAPISDEMWNALCQSVERHPKLEKICLPQYVNTWRDGMTEAQKTLKMQAMVDALRVNTVLHTIVVNRREFDEEIWTALYTPSSWPTGTAGRMLVLSPKRRV